MAESTSWIKINMFDSPDVKSKVNRRMLTEAEVRVQRSLEKLSIPDWYLNNSSKAPKILLRNSPDLRSGWRNSSGKSPMQYHKLSDSHDKRFSMNTSYPTPKPTQVVNNNHNQTVGVLLETSFDQRVKAQPPKPPVRKVKTNISKTFPKLSPSRKIENINIVFPPKKDLENSRTDASSQTSSEGLNNSNTQVTNEKSKTPQLYNTAMIDEVTLSTTAYDSDPSYNFVDKKLKNKFSTYLHLYPVDSKSGTSLMPIEETSEGSSSRTTPSPTLNETFLITNKKSSTLEKIVKAERPRRPNKLVLEIIETLKKRTFNKSDSENNSDQSREKIEPIKTVVNIAKSKVSAKSYPVKCIQADSEPTEAEILRKKIIEEKKREYYTKLAYLEQLKKIRGIPTGEKVENSSEKTRNSVENSQKIAKQKVEAKLSEVNDPNLSYSKRTPCRETTEALKRYRARQRIRYTSSPVRQPPRREEEEEEQDEINNSGLLLDIIEEFRKKCRVSRKQKSTPGSSNFVRKLVDVLERSVDQSCDVSLISSVHPVDDGHEIYLSDHESIYNSNSTSISLKNSDSDVYASSNSPDMNWSTVANTGAHPIEDEDEDVFWIPLPKKPLPRPQDSIISPYNAGNRYIKPLYNSKSSPKYSYRLSPPRRHGIQGSYNYDAQRQIWTSTLNNQNGKKSNY
ncbi:uncharacterized protein LOC123272013 [Cotesia glomerata]|uniref:Uncharacterized protein n=1 Tax=Cotesia glomerata TaxID=32391 RepID=A0AAV7IW18_COTGL|nr:uncharacterized protein LOC123272013 [Cotesia glomerata]KAH0558312.1 hypothetical protein KQX54_015587 [Cotesia glomerata]